MVFWTMISTNNHNIIHCTLDIHYLLHIGVLCEPSICTLLIMCRSFFFLLSVHGSLKKTKTRKVMVVMRMRMRIRPHCTRDNSSVGIDIRAL